MILYRCLGLICLLKSIGVSSPAPLTKDEFADSLSNAFRREDVSGKQLKQISLRSLVGDLESSMFASALSFGKALRHSNMDTNDDSEDNAKVLQSLKKEDNKNMLATETTTTSMESNDTNLAVAGEGILQNIQKIGQTNSLPTHIVIDRITIQSARGPITLMPLFEFKNKEKDTGAATDYKTMKTSIIKTDIKNLITTPVPDESSNFSSKMYSSRSVDVATRGLTTLAPEDILQPNTSPENIQMPNEAEEELKEQVAEIEADPVILSARL